MKRQIWRVLNSAMEHQRVMVIQDASKQVCSSAIKWLLHALFLKPGDLLLLLGVLPQLNDHTTLSFKGTRKLLGYSKKVDSSSKFAANHRILDREVSRKKEFENNAEILEISKLCKAEKIEFRIEVTSGDSPAVLAIQSAQNMNATWVILDRKMKKNKKIFLEKLSCGISRMTRNNGIKQLRGARTNNCVSYDEMMPGNPEDDDLFSIELFPTCGSEANEVSKNQNLTHTSSSADSNIAEETFENPGCVICDNRIQSIERRKDFTYGELHVATDGFSSKNNLSQLGSECTFRGLLENKQNIVIKPAKTNMFFQDQIKFKSEIDKLISVTYKDLVMLLGCCAEGTHRLLVYEYVCNGSLDQHLSKCSPMPLSWRERVKVSVGAAKGLSHLHQNNIVHKNIRASNIFLNHDFEPLLGDFGLATMWSKQNTQRSKYLSPEFLENGTMSTKTDVYSFGIVLLEIITGNLGHRSFVKWARTLLKQRRYSELVDPRIGDSLDVFQLYRMAQLAEKCVSKNPKKRLPMDKVVSTLEHIAETKSSISTFTHNSVKMEHENWYEDEDVTSKSFSANLWRSKSSSVKGKSYKSNRVIRTESSSQMHYGEMLN